jgi:phosphoribosylformimino-5-aminoimidazole carboxamide ribotide isomerase
MQLIPAVDLLGRDATRLEQGDYGRELFRRPATELVAAAAALGPPLIHLVDLEGARSGSVRPDVIAECLAAADGVPVQVSGGIRSVSTAERILELGAARVLVGTAAFGSRTLLDELVGRLGDRLGVSIDVRGGLVRVAGWLEGTAFSVAEAARTCVEAGVVRVLGTAIDRDGTDAGPDLELYRELCAYPLAVLAAGGVRHQTDVDDLAALGCEGAVTGRAFAEGRWPAAGPTDGGATERPR